MRFDLQLFGGRGGTSKLGGGIPANGSARSGNKGASTAPIKRDSAVMLAASMHRDGDNPLLMWKDDGNGGFDYAIAKDWNDANYARSKGWEVGAFNPNEQALIGAARYFASPADATKVIQTIQADLQSGDVVKVHPQNTGDVFISVDTAVGRPALSYMVDKNGKVKDLNPTASAQVNMTSNVGPKAATKAAIPASRVSVSTSAYQGSHGSTPRGSGTWAFDIGSETKFFSGKYSDAKKKAINYAAQKGISNIKVGP